MGLMVLMERMEQMEQMDRGRHHCSGLAERVRVPVKRIPNADYDISWATTYY
jgi:hypothetical protein